ncbi:MAG: dual specificity protein phosphatase family protein [Gammaproteobacteria bacterium]|nr:dual specificity protein phosphatase family protein [Gammaproteobacteria bacterium]
MKIHICSLFDMHHYARTLRPGFLVSAIQPEFQPETPPEVTTARHHRMAVHDITSPAFGSIHTQHEHMENLISFLKAWSTSNESLLIHCYAGISRSTAVALLALCIKKQCAELDAALALRTAAPHAKPNQLIISLADEILILNGRLIAALEAMGSGTPASEGPLVSLSIDA